LGVIAESALKNAPDISMAEPLAIVDNAEVAKSVNDIPLYPIRPELIMVTDVAI
jgi:hypothetical protein